MHEVQRREDGPGVLRGPDHHLNQMRGDLEAEGRGVHLVSEQEVGGDLLAPSQQNRRGGWEGSENSQCEGWSRSRTDLK